MEQAITPPHIYQFRVVVQGISPLVWRRLLVCSDMSLATLHAILQIVFAWSDVHLHYFHIHGKEYGSTRLGGPSFDVDPRHVPLADDVPSVAGPMPNRALFDLLSVDIDVPRTDRGSEVTFRPPATWGRRPIYW